MPLESLPASIEDLEDLWPLSTDIYTQGDDHLRYIKDMLKTQFPGAVGQGFDTPITATETEMGYLSGVASNVQAQLDTVSDTLVALGSTFSAEYGTHCLFAQETAPAGWTQVVTYDDYQLRVVNTAGGGTGGTDSPFTYDWAHTHTTSGHTLTVLELPVHTHEFLTCSDSNTTVVNASGKRLSVGVGSDALVSAESIANTGGSTSHTHGDLQNSTSQFRPKYLNVILAQNTTGTPPWDTDTFYGYARSLSPIRYWRLDDSI